MHFHPEVFPMLTSTPPSVFAPICPTIFFNSFNVALQSVPLPSSSYTPKQSSFIPLMGNLFPGHFGRIVSEELKSSLVSCNTSSQCPNLRYNNFHTHLCYNCPNHSWIVLSRFHKTQWWHCRFSGSSLPNCNTFVC